MKPWSKPFTQPVLETGRLALEPITEAHAPALCALFADAELHRYVPMEPPSLKEQQEKCRQWATRYSPNGEELWLNWVACFHDTDTAVGHFQLGLTKDGVATLGYVVARSCQRKGLAAEALDAVLQYLKWFGAKEARVYADSRNEASHGLARKLGMSRVEVIKNAATFKGSSSDEYVFSLKI